MKTSKRDVGMGWEFVKLGEIVKMVTGKTPPTNNFEYFDGEYLWVNPSDFGTKFITKSKRSISQKAVNEKKCSLLPIGTILLSCIGDIGKIGILKTIGSSNQQITGLISDEKVFSDYLYYYLMFSKAKLESLANKAVVAILNNERLRELEIPLPPLSTQKRIAEILDAADALRRKDQELLKKYDALAQAIFIDMFGDPVKNEKGWEVRKLGEVLMENESIAYGVVQPGDDVSEGIPIIRVGDFSNMKIDKRQLKRISPSIEEKHSRTRLIGDEILIACVGSIGKIALADKSCKGYNIVRATARLRADGNKVNRTFLAFQLSQETIQNYFISETRTSSQPTLNIRQIELTEILVPSIEEQNRFEDLIQKINEQKLLGNTIGNPHLFHSLLQQAFNGEL